ncbi:MAG: hypothetical protein IJB26_05515 [Clostridia bacterium]|nr:hypothetical protein [Clostridia bacterium]
MNKKNFNAWHGRLLSVVLVLGVLSYVGYQIYRSIFTGVDTELAVNYSVYESYETEGLVIRSETVIPMTTNGHIYYTVQNGTRVSKNGVIASVYATEQDGLLLDKIEDLDARIEMLKTLQSNDSSNHVTLDIIDTQLNSSMQDLIGDVSDGVFTLSDGIKTELLSLISKKQIITGKAVDFSNEINRLEQEKKALQAQYHQALTVVKAPVAGYFADSVDGYESLLSSIDPLTLTADKFNELLTTPVDTAVSAAGKIVGGYEWYFACIVPESYYNTLSVGSSLSLRMTFVTDEVVPVTVAACNKTGDGKLMIVLRCAYMSEDLADIRLETAQLLMVRHTGLRVPKRAIVIDDQMQAGVYVRSGNVASFRKIKQIYSEPADYVICEAIDKSGYLHLYDDIIVNGKGLYDGKTID